MDLIQRLLAIVSSPFALRIYFIITCGMLFYSIRNILLFLKYQQVANRFSLHFFRNYFSMMVISFILVLSSFLGIALPIPKIVSPSLPLFDKITLTKESPLELVFDRPITGSIQPLISPELQGSWTFESKSYGPFIKNVYVFTPDSFAEPDTEYTISINGLRPLLGISDTYTRDTLFVVSTAQLPEVIESHPQNGQVAYRLDEPLSIHLHTSNPSHVVWDYEFRPAVESTIDWDVLREVMTITPLTPLQYDTEYSLDLYRSLNRNQEPAYNVLGSEQTHVYHLSFTTLVSASVESVSFSDTLALPNEALEIVFTWPMNAESVLEALDFDSEVSYDTTWSDETHLLIQPRTPWELASTYVLTIGQEAETRDGGALSEAYIHRFNTVGSVSVLETTPRDESVGHDVTAPLSITFDQPVDQASVVESLQISPTHSLSYQWNDATLLMTPAKPLSFNTVYELTLDSGVRGIYGTPMISPYAMKFQTQSDSFSLAVPLYKQHYMFTCFTSAARMALGYKGVTISELGFLDDIGLDQTPRNYVANSWGNPNLGVVGHYNGAGSGGYGVHWDPVARAMSAYAPTEVKHDWNIPDLLEEVKAGNPVMVWWVNGVWPAKDVSWNVPSGEKVYTVNGMHVEVVKGWIGSQSNPDYILTNDPWRGERRYTQTAFYDLWRWFDNTAVVVR